MEEKISTELRRKNKRSLLITLGWLMITLGLFAYTLLITPQPLTIGFNNEIILSDLLIVLICIVIILMFGYFIFILNEWWDYEWWDRLVEQITLGSPNNRSLNVNTKAYKCPRCGTRFTGDLCVCGFILKSPED